MKDSVFSSEVSDMAFVAHAGLRYLEVNCGNDETRNLVNYSVFQQVTPRTIKDSLRGINYPQYPQVMEKYVVHAHTVNGDDGAPEFRSRFAPAISATGFGFVRTKHQCRHEAPFLHSPPSC